MAKKFKNNKINLYIPSPSAEVVEKFWSAPASVTSPQPHSPLLALGQAVSAPPSSSALMTHPPVLPGGPGSQSVSVALQGVCWASTAVRGGERAGWAEGRLACDPGPPIYWPDARGALEVTHVVVSPHEVPMAALVSQFPRSLDLPHWGLSLLEGGGSLPRRSSQRGNKSCQTAASGQHTSVSTKV